MGALSGIHQGMRALLVRSISDGDGHFLERTSRCPQRTAFFTSAAIFLSSAGVNSLSAHEVGHIVPSSRFAESLKPNVAYLALNLAALWKKQMTLPSLVYAGIPYHVFAEISGELALTISWMRLPMARSFGGIAAIASSAAFSSFAPCSSIFNSLAYALAAARSSGDHPRPVLPFAPVLFFVGFRVVFLSLIVSLRAVHRSWRSPSSFPSGSVKVATSRPPPTSPTASFTVAPAAVTSASFASMSC